jgi:hypothetical protein
MSVAEQIAIYVSPILLGVVAYFLNRLINKQDQDSSKITDILIAIGKYDVRQDSIESRVKALEEWKALIEQELLRIKINHH